MGLSTIRGAAIACVDLSACIFIETHELLHNYLTILSVE